MNVQLLRYIKFCAIYHYELLKHYDHCADEGVVTEWITTPELSDAIERYLDMNYHNNDDIQMLQSVNYNNKINY